jgi:uncharacterized protein YgiM (DUF1202 family)
MPFFPRYWTIALSWLIFLFFTGCGGIKIPSRESSAPPPSKEERPIRQPAPAPPLDQKGKEPFVAREKTWFVLAERMNLRACAGLNCQVLGTILRGEELVQSGESGEWIRVRVKATNKEGWVSSKYLGKERQAVEPASPPSREAPKLKEEWATSDKETKPSPSSPKEGFAK